MSSLAGTPIVRERSFSWEDPSIVANAARTMRGLDAMRAIATGELPPPPIAVTLGFELLEVDFGRALFALSPAEFHYNPIGVVHGGIAMTLLDSAMGCAVHTTRGAGEGYTTLQANVHLVRPLTADTGTVHAEGVVVHAGRTAATAEGKLTQASTGKLLAHATTSCLLIT